MQAREELSRIKPNADTVAAIGVFDGVHLGHQYLLRELRRIASQANVKSLVITFINHPRTVLRPDLPTAYLSSLERRLALLRAQGVDFVAPVTFDEPLSRMRAREFLDLLQKTVRVHGLVVGPDFAVGYQREGTVPVLRTLGQELGISVTALEPLTVGEGTVSSTAVRTALTEGSTVAVARMLGRAFCLDGKVTHGDRRGTALGFPTANLAVAKDMALPRDGIYATWALLKGMRYPSATSIGVRPTFGQGLARTVETFILDYRSGELYGQPVILEFADRLRDEQRFESAEALVAQMHRDVAQARAALREAEWMVAASPVS